MQLLGSPERPGQQEQPQYYSPLVVEYAPQPLVAQLPADVVTALRADGSSVSRLDQSVSNLSRSEHALGERHRSSSGAQIDEEIVADQAGSRMLI